MGGILRAVAHAGQFILKVGGMVVTAAPQHLLPWWCGPLAYAVGHVVGVNIPGQPS